jgi:hypothetical protein
MREKSEKSHEFLRVIAWLSLIAAPLLARLPVLTSTQ